MRWERLACGAIRFHGKDAMRELMDLLRDDPNYTWSIPSGWPAPFWIDVYPKNIEANCQLIRLVEEDGGRTIT